jgi:hypothetical protein
VSFWRGARAVGEGPCPDGAEGNMRWCQPSRSARASPRWAWDPTLYASAAHYYAPGQLAYSTNADHARAEAAGLRAPPEPDSAFDLGPGVLPQRRLVLCKSSTTSGGLTIPLQARPVAAAPEVPVGRVERSLKNPGR